MDIYQILNELYNKNKKGFYNEYGSDLIIAIIIIYVFVIAITYYYVSNHIPELKKNWSINRCKPQYLPFASLVIDNKQKSDFDIIGDNFSNCIMNILTSITSDALKSLFYTANVTSETMQVTVKSLSNINSLFSNVRSNIENITKDIYGRILNVTMPILKLTITTKNMMGQTQGTITAATYVLLSAYLTFKSLIKTIIEVIKNDILIPLAAYIVLLYLSWDFVGAVRSTAFYIAILVPLLMIIIAYNNIFHESEAPAPGPPACFGKYTLIKLANNTTKYIYEIDVDDVLLDGSTVTGVMQMSSHGHSTFNLDNIIVTGLHRVYHNNLGWIKVANHPGSREIKDYRENILYCLNTDTKVIKIKNFTFLDWDDLDDLDIKQINKNYTFIPKQLNNKDIHRYLDNGFVEDTLIELEVGTQIKIQNIEVNDILKFGERVLGIIKIDSTDLLAINEYRIGNSRIKCSSNIQVQVDNLNTLNTSNLEGTPIITNKYLYQLITNKGYFYIENIKVYDYNVGIEKYLDNTEFYSQNLYQ